MSLGSRDVDTSSLTTSPAPQGRRLACQVGDQEMVRVASSVKDAVLAEIVRRLAAELKPERIYLFGSRARGEATVHSDYDLLVVLPASDEPSYRVAQRAHGLLWDLGTAADILVWTREAFDRRLHLRASLPATVVREGSLLYGG